MKQKDIKPCSKCGKGVMHTGLPLFWKISIMRYGIDIDAVKRQSGLEMMLDGHATLANVMGPDEDIAKPVTGKMINITLCEHCAMENTPLAALAELEA